MKSASLPHIIIDKDATRHLEQGFPWVYQSAIAWNSQLEQLQPGTVVQVKSKQGKALGMGMLNARSIIALRMLHTGSGLVTIDEAFFKYRFEQALRKREALIKIPYYRLIHSEGDQLPGLIIDRFGDYTVCQTTTAGMELLKPFWVPALKTLLNPKGIIFRDDGASRKKEGLKLEVTVQGEQPPTPTEVHERNTIYLANLIHGQKTGWFYDQRENRGYAAQFANNQHVLDLYTHTGGFGLPAAQQGALSVTLVDASAEALKLASQAAMLNHVDSLCSYEEGNIFELLPAWINEGRHYGLIIADPPAFIKDKQYIASGLRGYQKLAFLCAQLLEPQGTLFIASCSHHAELNAFRRAVEAGIREAGRDYKLLRTSFADKDHVIHPQLQQNSYLKALCYRL
ncbi:MAG: class I SAM-dependent rRNA methyltransferase [Alphaproteobacteria bacterium]|nr:class I SAM-dependent rRNA methyltransferase [Alphaproteobacteria bacterium]